MTPECSRAHLQRTQIEHCYWLDSHCFSSLQLTDWQHHITLISVVLSSFYRAMLCIRGTIHGPVSVSVSVSVTSQCSTKTAKLRITQTTPNDTPGTLVFWCQRSPRNLTRVTPYEGAECRWGGQNRRLSTNNRLYLENGTRQTHSFY